jgi:hypothetical protein
MGNTGCNNERKTQRKMDGWMDGLTQSMTRTGLEEEDTNDRDIWG